MSARDLETLEVLEPGLLLTVQDLGRPGYEDLGVPQAGAADGAALAIANGLVGNSPNAAGLEGTLLGPRLRALRQVTLALAGADLDPIVEPGGRSIDPARPFQLAAGDELAFRATGDPDRGCRVYVAIAGGIDVPVILGSRSTSLVGSFGGFNGRPLRAGDIVAALAPEADRATLPPGDAATTAIPSPDRPIRVFRGPAAAEPGGAGRWAAFLAAPWTVGLDSDRRGLRLEPGPGAPPLSEGAAGDRPSHGVVVGAIQLTPSGQPLVLMPDGGVTGGYPVLAIVASSDRSRLGQLTPGAEIRFTEARVRFSE